MPLPSPFNRGEKLSADRLNRAFDARVGQITGDNRFVEVSLAGDKATVRLNLEALLAQIPKLSPFPIRLTGTELGAGKYTAVVIDRTAGDVTTDDDLVADDFGDDGQEVLALNFFEIGQTGGTHDLTPGGDELFPAIFVQTNSDGTRVVGFWGVDPNLCAGS